MIFSKEILEQISFYESDPLNGSNSYAISIITIHWKQKWYNFYKKPTVIKTTCIFTDEGGFRIYNTSDEFDELNEQLRKYFSGDSDKLSCKLYAINGGIQ